VTLGKRIFYLRKIKKFTQFELARKVGIDFTYISKIENDKIVKGKGPSSEVLKKIATILSDSNSYEQLYEELMLLAEKVPDTYQKVILENKDVFLRSYKKGGKSLFAIIKTEVDKRNST